MIPRVTATSIKLNSRLVIAQAEAAIAKPNWSLRILRSETYRRVLEITDKENLEASLKIAGSTEKAAASIKKWAAQDGGDHQKWAISGVLDWRNVRSVPLVLYRKLPTWFWFDEDKLKLKLVRRPQHQARTRSHRRRVSHQSPLRSNVSRASPTCIEDAYYRGSWFQALARFAIIWVFFYD
jgi:hypothetical protein